KRSPTQLRNDQIEIAITRNVSNSDGSRLRQLHSVQMHIFRFISPAASAEIPEQAHLPTARSFPYRDKIEPAVIVIVNRGNSPAAFPRHIRQLHTLEPFALDVAPQTNAGRARVGEGQIHPAIFVEVES